MRDVLKDADQKRREAEALRRLAQDNDFALFCELIDQVASVYINQLIQPVPEDWKSHFLRGLVKGLDEAKTLPLRVVRAYDNELQAASRPVVPDNPSETMRLSPEPKEIQ